MAGKRARLRIAFVIDWIGTIYHEELIEGVAAYCEDAGIDLVVVPIGRIGSPHRRESMRNILLGLDFRGAFDGAIVTTAALGNVSGRGPVDAFLDGLGDLPCVTMGSAHGDRPAVLPDNRSGILAMMRHLAEEHGYSRIAFVAGPAGNEDAEERFAAYKEFLADRGLPFDPALVLEGDFGRGSGRALSPRLASGEMPPFDAVLFANDGMALGCLEFLAERGDAGGLRLAGFDDDPNGAPLGLSTARVSTRELANAAAAILHGVIEGRPAPHGPFRFRPELVVRRSCGCAPASYEGAARREPSDRLTAEEASLVALAAMATAQPGSGGTLPGKTAAALSRALVSSLGADVLRDEVRSVLESRGFPAVRGALLAAREALARRGSGRKWLGRIDAAYLSCEEAESRRELRELQGFYYKLNSIEEAGDALIASLEADALLDAVDDLAAVVGVDELHISLFTDPAEPMAGSTLVFSRYAGRRRPLRGGRRFPTASILPAAALRRGKRRNLLLLSLFQGSQQIGTCCFSFEPGPLEPFEVLRSKLGIALKASSLYEELASRAVSLEREVAARVAEIERAKGRLEAEVAERRKAQRRLRALLRELEGKNIALINLSLRDELTGLLNRRGFLEFSAQAARAASRRGSGFLLVFADMDGLKRVNDSFGHAEGDAAIKETAAVLRRSFRECDIVSRLGGDEFAILMLESGMADSEFVRERIDAGCARASEGRPYRISISAGFEEWGKGSAEDISAVLARADVKLYEMKAARKVAGAAQSPESPPSA